MKQFIKNAKFISIFVLAISFLGCEEDDTMLPKVIADFSYTLNDETGTVTFINTSEEATTYEWDFGDGNTSTEINPINTYTETGEYKVVLKASNVAGSSETFEDNIAITIKEGITLPITFDNATVNYKATVFGGASFEIVANPDESGSNGVASKVGAITNAGNASEGFFFDLVTSVDLTENKTIQMNFWSEQVVDLLLKLEEGTGDDAELTITHGGTGWEQVSFDFPVDASYSRLTFFVDPLGTTAGTFYMDDVEQVATVTPETGCVDTPVAATALPLDFEGCATFPSEDNFGDGITSTLAANPSKTGVNTSDFVLQIDKPTGSDFFAGIQNTFQSNFDLTTTDTFKAKVYSTKANVVFRFELAVNPQTVPVTGNPAPVFVTIPNANVWTEIEFTFTSLPGGPTAYNQLVIKPDNDMADSPITAGGTYYIDDFTLSTAGGGGGAPGQGEIAEACAGSLLQDYESADNSIFSNFGGGVATIVDNPNTTVNTSAKVGQMEKFAGDLFGGTTMSLGAPVDFSSGEVFTMDVFSQRASDLTFKLEGLNIEKVITTSGTGWETMTFDFTGQTGAASVSAITLIFDNGTSGDAAGDPDAWTFLFDNLRLCDSGGGGGAPGQGEIAEACAGSLLQDYESADNSIFSNFGGGVATIVDNPNTTVNTSAKVGQMEKFAGDLFGGTTMSLGAPVDFSSGEVFTMDVFSQRASDLTFKLEGLNIEKVITTSGTGWETMTFDFTGQTGAASVSAITLIFDNGTSGDAAGDPDAWTFLFDNLRLCDSGGGGGAPGQGEIAEACAGSLLQDYESADNSIFSNFGGGVATIVDNPNTTVNTSAKVGQMEKFAGDLFGGTTMSLGAPVDFSSGEVFTMDVFSQRASDLTFKLEGLNIEKVITTSGTGWETMTFDFTGQTGAASVSAITLIFDNGTSGDAAGDPDAWTFLFDNLRLCDSGGGGGAPGQGEIAEACAGSLLQDYESADNSIFSNFGGGVATIVDNPNTTVNTSAKVGQMEKFAGDLFGGTTMSLGAPVDFSSGEVFTMDVFSQRASDLTFKLEGLNIEKVITTSGTGWETMTFDFTGQTGAASVSAITLIFDNGTSGDAAGDPDAWTFLFDNLRLCDSGGGGGGGADCPAPPAGDLVSNGDFEAGEGCWQLLQNGGTVTFSTTESNGGGTNSAQIQTGPGVNPGIKQERFAVGVYSPNTEYRVTFDIKASTPLAIGAVFKAFTFSEGAEGSATPATQHILEGGLATVSSNWETKTYIFTSAAGSDQVAGGISFLAELVCGPAGCEGVVNIDNVSIVLNQ